MDMEMFEQNMHAFNALNKEFGEERIFMPPLEDLSEVQFEKLEVLRCQRFLVMAIQGFANLGRCTCVP